MTKCKFAFFDFDDTLLPKDSMGRLVLFCIKKHPLSFISLFPLAFYSILYGLKIIDFIPLKEKLLFPLKYCSMQELNEFYQLVLIPHYYPTVVEILLKRKKEGYLIWLVSASPEVYLQFTDLPVDQIIGTKTEIRAGKPTNKIISKNCKGEEKVQRIQTLLKEQQLEIDYENSYGYSDSTSDLPMLKLVKNRIRISKKNGSMSPF